MEAINKNIQSVFGISEEQADIFLSAFTKIELKKNEVFMEQGQVCHKVGLIEKGLMKCVFDNNGEELVFEFSYENSFISDYYSFLTQTPSQKEIRCMEDTTVYVVTRQALLELSKEHPFIIRMSNDINAKLFIRMHDRLKSFLLDNATERYQKLLAERQDLAQRIPQYFLASYLNVKPETISRIRKKIAP
jgi:CRP-like cAMP-binding protein